MVVINCSGHTFPVEIRHPGRGLARGCGIAGGGARAAGLPPKPQPQEGLLAALRRLDERVRSMAIMDDNPEAARLIRRILQARGDYEIIHQAADGRQAWI